MNPRWPCTFNNNLVPWYTILWRACWVPAMFVGRVLFVAAVLGCYGLKEAERSWEITK
jgi:hypothetical protein